MEKKIKLLYAEDDEDIRDVYAQELSKQNFDVHTASDGNEAWEMYSREPWDILLLDIEMPGKNGEEVIRLVREVDNQIPIVILSGFDQDLLTVMEADGGADDYVSKCSSIKTLTDRLGKRLRDSLRRASRGELRVFRLSPHTTYDKVSRALTIDGETQILKYTISKIMLFLCLRVNQEVMPNDFFEFLGWPDGDAQKKELSTYISQLRKVLKKDTTIELEKAYGKNCGYSLITPTEHEVREKL